MNLLFFFKLLCSLNGVLLIVVVFVALVGMNVKFASNIDSSKIFDEYFEIFFLFLNKLKYVEV
jgi:hypothetical protein